MTLTEQAAQRHPAEGQERAERDPGRMRIVGLLLGGLAVSITSYAFGFSLGQENERLSHCPSPREHLQLAPGLPQSLDDSATSETADMVLAFEEGRLKVGGPAVQDGHETRPLNGDGSYGSVTVKTSSPYLPTQFDFVREGSVLKVSFLTDPNC